MVMGEVQVGTERHRLTSELQSRAIEAILMQAGDSLSNEDRASLSSMISTAPFTDDNAVMLMSRLTQQAAEAAPSARSPQQNMICFVHYASASEWEMATQMNQEAAFDVFASMLIHRLHCFNPSEHTFRRLTAVVLVCSMTQLELSGIPAEQKRTHMLKIKDTYRQRVRAFKQEIAAGTCSAPALPSLQKLPPLPQSLEQSHPGAMTSVKISGCWTPVQIDMNHVTHVETSFSCRGAKLGQLTTMAPMQFDPMGQMQMMAQMMGMCMGRNLRGGGNDGELRLEYPATSRKRSLAALLDHEANEQPRRRIRSCSSWESLGSGSSPNDDSQRLDEERPGPPAVSALPASGVGPLEPPLEVEPPLVPVDVQPRAICDEERPHRGGQLLDALISRDDDRALKKKQDSEWLYRHSSAPTPMLRED